MAACDGHRRPPRPGVQERGLQDRDHYRHRHLSHRCGAGAGLRDGRKRQLRPEQPGNDDVYGQLISPGAGGTSCVVGPVEE